MQIQVLNQKQYTRMIRHVLIDYANLLNAADVMKTCKNTKKMIGTHVL